MFSLLCLILHMIHRLVSLTTWGPSGSSFGDRHTSRISSDVFSASWIIFLLKSSVRRALRRWAYTFSRWVLRTWSKSNRFFRWSAQQSQTLTRCHVKTVRGTAMDKTLHGSPKNGMPAPRSLWPSLPGHNQQGLQTHQRRMIPPVAAPRLGSWSTHTIASSVWLLVRKIAVWGREGSKEGKGGLYNTDMYLYVMNAALDSTNQIMIVMDVQRVLLASRTNHKKDMIAPTALLRAHCSGEDTGPAAHQHFRFDWDFVVQPHCTHHAPDSVSTKNPQHIIVQAEEESRAPWVALPVKRCKGVKISLRRVHVMVSRMHEKPVNKRFPASDFSLSAVFMLGCQARLLGYYVLHML